MSHMRRSEPSPSAHQMQRDWFWPSSVMLYGFSNSPKQSPHTYTCRYGWTCSASFPFAHAVHRKAVPRLAGFLRSRAAGAAAAAAAVSAAIWVGALAAAVVALLDGNAEDDEADEDEDDDEDDDDE